MEESKHRRTHERVGIRTSVTIVTKSPQPKVYRAWTDDLSPAGARVLCDEPIAEDEMYIRVLLPGLQDQLFEGKTVRSNFEKIGSFRGLERQMHAYGIQFTGICDVNEIRDIMDIACNR